MTVIIGDNAFEMPPLGEMTAILVGRCNALELDRRDGGIGVNATVYNSAGALIAKIADNKIDVLTNDTVDVNRRGDLTRLVVTSKGEEVLNIHFLNPRTIEASGVFGCPGSPTAVVKPGVPIGGATMSGVCAMGLVGVQLP